MDIETINIIIKLRKSIIATNKSGFLQYDVFDEPPPLEMEHSIQLTQLVEQQNKYFAKLEKLMGKEKLEEYLYLDNCFTYTDENGDEQEVTPYMEQRSGIGDEADGEGQYLTFTYNEEKLKKIGSTYYVEKLNINRYGHDLINVNGNKYAVKRIVRLFTEYVLTDFGGYDDNAFDFSVIINELQEDFPKDFKKKPKTIRAIFGTKTYKELQKELFHRVEKGVYRCKVKQYDSKQFLV